MSDTTVRAREGAEHAALPAPGTAEIAGERALRVVVLVWSGAWLAVMAFVQGVSSSLAPALSTAMLLGLAVGWVVVVAARLPVGAAYVGVLAVTALVQATVTMPVGMWTESTVLITWSNLATISCGLLVAGTRGRLGIVAIAAAQLVVLAARAGAEGTLGLAWQGIVAASAYALADGMAARVAATAVRAQARSTDEAADRLALERGRRAEQDAEAGEVARVSRVLHDTVLNTLGALRRGVAADDVAAMRARCADDLRELRRLRDTKFEATGDTGVAAEALAHALAARGGVLALDVAMHRRIAAPTTLPTAVADAVAGACAEALNNVATHSGVRAAQVDLRWDGALLEVSVHDDGCGWSGEPVEGRGVADSILRRAADAGIEALVATAPGQGTTVTLVWRSETPPSSAPEERSETPPVSPEDLATARMLARVAVGAGGWITGLLAFLTAVYWGTTDPAPAVAALGILGLVLLTSWQVGIRHQRVPLSWVLAALLVVATFLVAALPARTAATCDQLAEAWWGLDGSIVVLLSLVLLTRGYWWCTAASAAMVLGALSLTVRDVPLVGDCADSLGVYAVAQLTIVVALVIFREAVLRQWSRAAAARARSEELRIDTDVRAATERARDARVDSVIASTVPLLDTLASGRADPCAAGVRRRSTVAEGALRALITLGPADDWMREVLGEAVLAAFAQGSVLEVMPSVREVPVPANDAAAPMRALLAEVVARVPEGQSATAALVGGPQGCGLTLVAASRLGPVSRTTVAGLRAAGLDCDEAEMGAQYLVEVRWS